MQIKLIMKVQLLETWRIHHRMNELLIDNTTEEGFGKTHSLKQCAQKIPDAVKWGLWEWSK